MSREILVLLLFLTAFFSVSCNAEKEKPAIKINSSAKTESIDSMKLEDLKIYGSFDEIAPIFEYKNDTTYIINFWATWCKPCVEELPYFEALFDDFESEKVKIILVSLDFPNAIETKLIPFLNENKLKSEVIVLTDGRYNEWIDKVDTDWGGAIPVTIVYNKQDRKFIGRQFEKEEELKGIVEYFVKQ